MFSFSTTKVAFLSKFRTGLLTFYFIDIFEKCISNNYTYFQNGKLFYHAIFLYICLLAT